MQCIIVPSGCYRDFPTNSLAKKGFYSIFYRSKWLIFIWIPQKCIIEEKASRHENKQIKTLNFSISSFKKNLHCDFGGMTNIEGSITGNSFVFSLNGTTLIWTVALVFSGSLADTESSAANTGLLCGDFGDTGSTLYRIMSHLLSSSLIGL